MIRENLFSFAFIQKSPFFGSFGGWRYRIGKSGDALEVCVYPEPYDYEHTPEESRERKQFPFTPDGYEQAKQYLEERLG